MDLRIFHLIQMSIIIISVFFFIKILIDYRLKKMLIDKNIEDKDSIQLLLRNGIKLDIKTDSTQFGILLILAALTLLISIFFRVDNDVLLALLMIMFGAGLIIYPRLKDRSK